MMWINSMFAVTLIGLVGIAPATAQQSLTPQSPALKEIRETAADICVTVEQKGRKSDAQLTGEVEAKVTGIVAKLADLGLKTSGQIGSQEYQGLSQEALATALNDIRMCRKQVFDKLVDRLLPLSANPNPRPSPPHQETIPNSEAVIPPQPVPSTKRISVGAFSIGDSIEQVRASGIQGEFSVNKDGQSQFIMPIAVPIGHPNSFTINKEGRVIYIFTNKIIDTINVIIMDRGSCDHTDFSNINWPRFLLSQTIQELGEPTEPPSERKDFFPINGQPFSENIIRYTFSTKGEMRIIEVVDATGANNWSQKACLFFSSHARGN